MNYAAKRATIATVMQKDFYKTIIVNRITNKKTTDNLRFHASGGVCPQTLLC
jgi:hypothetical protein